MFFFSFKELSHCPPEWLYQFPFPPTVEDGCLLCTPQRMWFLNRPLKASTSPSPSGPCVASPESHLSCRRIFQARTEAALGMEGGSRVTVPTRHAPLQSAVVFAKQPFLLFFFCLAYGSSHCKPARFPHFCFLRACSVAQKCLTLCDAMDCSPPGSSVLGDSPGKNPGVGCHALPQEIFPTLHLLSPALAGGFFTTHPGCRDCHPKDLNLQGCRSSCSLSHATREGFTHTRGQTVWASSLTLP